MKAAAPQESASASHKYTGALEGFENKVPANSFDPVAWTLDRHDKAPMRMTFKATSKKQAEQWQKAFHAKLVELVGGFPQNHVPLAPRVRGASGHLGRAPPPNYAVGR